MLEILPIIRHELVASECLQYEAFPGDQNPFKIVANPSSQLILSCLIDNQPVGLISADLYAPLKQAYLSYFFVLPTWRNEQIGLRLMNALLTEIKKLFFDYLITKWDDFLPEALFFRKILIKTGWTSPSLLSKRYFFQPKTFSPIWLVKEGKLPQNFSIFPWQELTANEHEFIINWLASFKTPPSFSPFSSLPFSPINSLGFRLKGQLAGWIITHQLPSGLLRYTAFFTFPEAREARVSIALLRESIKRHIAKRSDLIGMMEINAKLSSPNWIRFIKRCLAPVAIRTEETLESYIKL